MRIYLTFFFDSVSTVELFLPHIAVAFGFAQAFSDNEALSFSLGKLYGSSFFEFDLSIQMLKSLQSKLDLKGLFNRFAGFSVSGIPLDPVTFEVFDINNYLPEIQFSLDLAPSINFAAPNFRASDLFDAVFPKSFPTVKSFGSFIKKAILSKIRQALSGLFDTKVNIPTIGLSVDDVSFGFDGFSLGNYTEFNNELFPPMIDVDAVQVSVYNFIVYSLEKTVPSQFLLRILSCHVM